MVFGKKSGAPSPVPLRPRGELVQLSPDQLKPSPNNPRRLFDPEPLARLRESIVEHGVLVPLVVYRLPGQDRFAIVDGERRYRCCLSLAEEGHDIEIPANIVAPPDSMAALLYMFNIHQFREQWDLMPTAHALKSVMAELGTDDASKLQELTGLSKPQIERCRRILSFPEKFQQMSLAADPKERVPSNFWVEAYPVLEAAEDKLPELARDLGRDGITQALVGKYRNGNIKSVIHFRRITEAFEAGEESGAGESVARRLHDYIVDPDLETREAFDGFIQETRRLRKAEDASDVFIRAMVSNKVEFAVDGREAILEKLKEVLVFVEDLIGKLEGGDPPTDEGDA